MKRNHSLLEYTRDNDTQVSELAPSVPSFSEFGFISFRVYAFMSQINEIQLVSIHAYIHYYQYT